MSKYHIAPQAGLSRGAIHSAQVGEVKRHVNWERIATWWAVTFCVIGIIAIPLAITANWASATGVCK